MSVFLFLLVPKLFGDAAYYVLNRTINFEWRDEAKCGDLKVKNKNENTLALILINIPFFIQIKMINGVSMSLLCQKRQ